MRSETSERKLFEEALEAASSQKHALYAAKWLRSPYKARSWTVHFGGSTTQINWDVLLEDKSHLTDPQHQRLLHTFKSFLLAQSHLDATAGLPYASSTTAARVSTAIRICEYMLINAHRLQLAQFGLDAFTESDGYQMLRAFSTEASCDAIYDWTSRVQNFLRAAGKDLSPRVREDVLKASPFIAMGIHDGTLMLSSEEVVSARIWLWLNGFYCTLHRGDQGCRYTVRQNKFLAHIYPCGTLRSNWQKPTLAELNILPGPYLAREMPSAPVRASEGSGWTLRDCINAIGKFRLLGQIGLSVPKGLLLATQNRAFIAELTPARPGRYATLPHLIVLTAFARAVEFSLKFGQEILDAYAAISNEALSSGETVAHHLTKVSIARYLGPNLRDLGTDCWSLQSEIQKSLPRSQATFDPLQVSQLEAAYFRRFREGRGLYELLLALGGAIQIVIGTLMARRQGELVDLVAGNCLSLESDWLIFERRKSGSIDARDRVARPIPSVGARLIRMLESFQEKLIAAGSITGRTNLFSFPKARSHGLAVASSTACNDMLDVFCDFIQIPVNARNQRHYIRHHQLRRFFPMIFFWGNSFSGLDTLRWFLGQTDPEHLYNYITESTPGAILRDVKIDYAVESTLDEDPQTLPLLQLIESRYGTRSVKVLDAEELSLYVEELVLEGKISIEPEFFDGPDGRSFRILILVSRGTQDERTT
ncbi:hypothetical protein [Variovorax paradoxus]|nr:hypothetical protein [Variovorax paradoxus]